MWGRRAIWQRKFGSRPNLQAQSAFLGASWVYGPDCKPQRTFRGQPPQAALRPRSRLPPRRPCGLSCGLGVSDPSPQAPPFRAGCRFFPKLRTCIHNQRMPDGRGILLPCKAKKRRQYFVYCKIFQRGRPAKDPLRRYQMVVNTGSYMQGGFFTCKKPPLAASRQFTRKKRFTGESVPRSSRAKSPPSAGCARNASLRLAVRSAAKGSAFGNRDFLEKIE